MWTLRHRFATKIPANKSHQDSFADGPLVGVNHDADTTGAAKLRGAGKGREGPRTLFRQAGWRCTGGGCGQKLGEQGILFSMIAGFLNSVVSVYYYLRVVVAMYFRDNTAYFESYSSAATAVIVVVLAVIVLGLGILPTPVLMLVQ